ncbi:MAG: carboxymuconolactone decarboxylase family protein [Desulfosarcinaceae bacterium]|nr:carboxymuconolactone decarboxylase family protein [Desulfosarcinaceae bacterium]
MADARIEKTQRTASLYFKGVTDERPYELWREFDPEMAKALSLFVTGDLYAREKLPHTTRQLVSVGALTVLNRPEELRLHIQAALNVGCLPEEIAEAIFQTIPYGGVPTVNTALKTFRQVLIDRDEWPLTALAP